MYGVEWRVVQSARLAWVMQHIMSCMAWHVDADIDIMSCHAMSCDVIRCDVIISCDAIRCDALHSRSVHLPSIRDIIELYVAPHDDGEMDGITPAEDEWITDVRGAIPFTPGETH